VTLPVVIRFAYPDDAEALAGLASLDEGSVPPEPVLLAEVDGELWGALSLRTYSHVADPFRPSGELVDLLRHRARQLCPAPAVTRRRHLLRWPRRRIPLAGRSSLAPDS
jgi:hypothetical protein